MKTEAEAIFSEVDQRQMVEDCEPDRQRAPNKQRAAGLEYLKRRRDSGEKPALLRCDYNGETDFGYSQLLIPPFDYDVLIIRYPELASTDRETAHRAWQKFANSPESLRYRTDASIGRRKPNSRIIVK